MSFIKKHKKLFISLAVTFSILLVLFVIGAVYVSDFYRADRDAISAFCTFDNATVSDNGNIIYAPEEPNVGFIFYPGGKVEHSAYEPLMSALADRGVLCIIAKMPFNLAVLDPNAADGIMKDYPDIESWYIGGHSLGGSMAAQFVSTHDDKIDGLILLGSYSAADISKSEIRVLSVFGSEDKVMNRQKYESCKNNLPDGLTEKIIEGGCHAYFGMYGNQEGDGKPHISCEEQITITAEIIYEYINN